MGNNLTVMTVPLLQNGLLDLSKTPDHLIPIAQRNATQSPLLRLPAEIRSKIFLYATSGTEFLIAMPPGYMYIRSVKGPMKRPTRAKAVDKVQAYTVTIIGLSGGNTTNLRRSGLYLPQVSRQIYSETATLIFENNTFALNLPRVPDRWDQYRLEGLLSLFINALIPAQRASIRELKFIGRNQLLPLAHRFQDREPPLTAVLPNLEVVWLEEGYEKSFSPMGRPFPDMDASDIVNYGEHKRVDIAWY